MISGIYAIENLVNGKKYIGQTIDFLVRWRNHKNELRGNYHDNNYLQRAWNKYGEDNFKFEIIQECPPILEILKLMEIYFIAYYNSFGNNGYNLTYGGEGNLGWIPKEETKEKISKANSGENNFWYGKTGEGVTNWGNHHTPETKKRQSEANIGIFVGEKSPLWGKIPPPERIYKQTLTRIGRKLPNSPSLFYGVNKSTEGCKKKWRVRIKLNKIEYRVGLYDDELDAAFAYDKYIVEHKLNYPLNFPSNYPEYPLFKNK